MESYNADHKTAMEKIAVQEKQIDSITDIVEGFSTHFSNIGERQTKMEQQMLGQTKSLQNLTQTIESLTKFILGPTALTPESQNPTQSQYSPYTPTKGHPISQLTPNIREPIPTAVGDGNLL